jgi:formate--tetrahydrofolate ligase
VLVAVNHFDSDTEAELDLIQKICRDQFDVDAVICRHWSLGGAGAFELAKKVTGLVEKEEARFRPLYPDELPLIEKMRVIAREIYRADDIMVDAKAQKKIAEFEAMGFGHLPVCVAKTQYSFSADPTLLGAPLGYVVPVRDARLAAGAGFVVMICGDIMTMPGLPRSPAAERIGLGEDGEICGLF